VRAVVDEAKLLPKHDPEEADRAQKRGGQEHRPAGISRPRHLPQSRSAARAARERGMINDVARAGNSHPMLDSGHAARAIRRGYIASEIAHRRSPKPFARTAPARASRSRLRRHGGEPHVRGRRAECLRSPSYGVVGSTLLRDVGTSSTVDEPRCSRESSVTASTPRSYSRKHSGRCHGRPWPAPRTNSGSSIAMTFDWPARALNREKEIFHQLASGLETIDQLRVPFHWSVCRICRAPTRRSCTDRSRRTWAACYRTAVFSG